MSRHLLIPCVLALCLYPALARTQNVTEWSSETRLILSFRVNPEVLQKLLPPGWTSAPSASPTSPGANLNVTMMERAVVLDPSGKPLRAGTSRYVVFGAAARNTQGQVNTLIINGLSPEGAGAYGVYKTAATATLERTTSGDGEQPSHVQEAWTFAAATGERLEVRATYRRGPVTKGHVDTVVRSGARPDFQRTYHIDQAVDLLRGTGVTDRIEQLSFKATGGSLAALFDGSESLLSVSAVPFYVREISIP